MLPRSRLVTATVTGASSWRYSSRYLQEAVTIASHKQCFARESFRHYSSCTILQNSSSAERDSDTLRTFKKSLTFPSAKCSFDELESHGLYFNANNEIVLHGYLGTRRDASKSLTFAQLHDIRLEKSVQLVSTAVKGEDGADSSHQLIRCLQEHTPVTVLGNVVSRKPPKPKYEMNEGGFEEDVKGKPTPITHVEVKVNNIFPLNEFPEDIIMTKETVFPPEKRHLQIRNEHGIRDALAFRCKVTRVIRNHLCGDNGFTEIETPLLFKSTPEGAREFLVPTRAQGLAYALPQSPQQYKQILMASGIPRYMQIAKCFRDEDLRADRQPEFTQIDLEMAFAGSEDVMQTVEALMRCLWDSGLGISYYDGTGPYDIPRMTYEEAMSKHGSDKPDLRLVDFGLGGRWSEIRRIEYMLPVDLIQKIGPLSEPVVEVMKLGKSAQPEDTREFITSFMDSPEALPFLENPDGQPGIFIFDSRKPLQGLQPFGFEAAEQLEEMLELEDGDLVILQARKNVPFSGGSTPIGNLRLALQRAALEYGFDVHLIPSAYKFVWITDFPLFTATNDAEPGQGGSAGIASTHHPFTTPNTAEDVDLLLTNPLAAKADHYDLVCNGVELGGGSRRIHNSKMQEFIMRNVLKMSEERMKDFSHLLEVLRAGCPPHAGIALGLDRLIAVVLGKDSVRDVIAFPKSGKGEDLLVQSPRAMTEAQLETYHLKLRK